MAAEETKLAVSYRAPKDHTTLDGDVVVGGFTCASLGLHETVGLFFSPASGALVMRARCGCRVEAQIAPLLEDLARMMRRQHEPGASPGLMH